MSTLRDITELSNLDNCQSSDDMQSALEKIHKLSKLNLKFEEDHLLSLLSRIHDAFRVFLERKSYSLVAKMLNDFTEDDDINVIKTALIITKSFKDNEDIKDSRQRLLDIFNNQYSKL